MGGRAVIELLLGFITPCAIDARAARSLAPGPQPVRAALRLSKGGFCKMNKWEGNK